MNIRATSIIGGVLAVSLSFLYAIVILSYLRSGAFFPSNALEATILCIQAVKLIAILSIGRLRNAKFTNILNIWAVEILAVPPLIGLSISQGNPAYTTLAGEIFLAWASAMLMVFPTFAIYKLTTMVQGRSSLTKLLPSATSVFALLTFLVAATTRYDATSAGLSGLAKAIPSAVKDTSIATTPEVSAMGALLYLGLIVYAATQWHGEAIQVQLESILILSLVGTVAALSWAFLAQATDSALLDFGLPTLACAAIVWLFARGE
ncbi:MAG: hypothetical protein ABSA72_04195 [Nitrososphaerales archaeon]|jgi:hypothetical protein